MIDLYFFPSPNTWKVSIMLEECALPYHLVPVDLNSGAQLCPAFLAINPNNKVPAIVDRDTPAGPITLFESGAILVYLAEKANRLMPSEAAARFEVLQWLFWQVGGLGPMAGQAHVFRNMDPPVPAALERYTRECRRLYTVMNQRLTGRSYLAGDYSIADIACFGWVWFHKRHGQDLAAFPAIDAWFHRLLQRPAVHRGWQMGLGIAPDTTRELILMQRPR
jgi:GSH-dependent disulfide-bond oxidoreductase